ncbi:MAG: hypothetical protein ACPGVO_10445 [Spirulinaceae cyanobacterium]
MPSRLLTLALAVGSPLLLGCGSSSTELILSAAQDWLVLTVCEYEPKTTVPDCDALIDQLRDQEPLVVRDAWFNQSLAGDFSDWALEDWFRASADAFLVNQLVYDAANEQWIVQVWLQRGEELLPIDQVFPRFTAEFWEILENSIYAQVLYHNPDTLVRSRRSPVDWETLTSEQQAILDNSPERQGLLELFEGNHLVLDATFAANIGAPRRGCGRNIESVFGE